MRRVVKNCQRKKRKYPKWKYLRKKEMNIYLKTASSERRWGNHPDLQKYIRHFCDIMCKEKNHILISVPISDPRKKNCRISNIILLKGHQRIRMQVSYMQGSLLSLCLIQHCQIPLVSVSMAPMRLYSKRIKIGAYISSAKHNNI